MDAASDMQEEIAALREKVASPELAVPDAAASSAPSDFALPEVGLPEVPELALPSFPSLPPELLQTAKLYIDEQWLPLIAASVLLPTGLLLITMFTDLLTYVIRRPQPLKLGSSIPTVADDGTEIEAEQDTFRDELSAWPAILEIQRGLASLPPEEQRRIKLEVGTNFPPRTTTTRPFDDAREGFTFFQGPTPLTGVQEGMPDYFSKANFEAIKVPGVLKVLIGVFSLSFLALAVLLLL